MKTRLFMGQLAVTLLLAGYSCVFSQSSDQNNPTPVTSNSITGVIKARAIGDSRKTTYFFVFEGNRGDVFLNVVTKNLNGSFDVFTLNGLKPRTKITVFADNPESETGRVVYMREAERLLLRIQGRTPNDDDATFQLKFAGSFASVNPDEFDDSSPEVAGNSDGLVRVNAAGVIIPDPPRTVVAAKIEDEKKAERDERIIAPVDVTVSKNKSEKDADSQSNPSSSGIAPVEVTVSNPGEVKINRKPIEEMGSGIQPEVKTAEPVGDSQSLTKNDTSVAGNAVRTEVTVGVNRAKPKRSALVTISRETDQETKARSMAEKLASISLNVELTSGGVFSRPMNEVVSVNVIKGVLTVVTSEGQIIEFSILEVAKFSIE